MALKMVDLPEQDQMVKNIIFTFLNASEEDMLEGMSWYQDAFNECVRIASTHNLPITSVAALVSVISPSLMWGGNIAAPEKIIDLWLRKVPVSDWQGFGIYPHNLHKAEAILNGDLSVVRGLKVNAFMLNILGHKDSITIDRWSIRVALDMPKLTKDKIVPGGIKVYNALSDAYHKAGQLLGKDGVDVQAVTWTVYRNKYNGKVRKQKERLNEHKMQAGLPIAS